MSIITASVMKKQEQNLEKWANRVRYAIIICTMNVYQDKKRKQMIKVVLAEISMVLAVILIVVVATLAAMGFFVSGDGNIEQSGLAQIHSMPTGATVELDGNVLFSRTNLSRTMPEGEHWLKISRDKYDSWENTLRMKPGILLRLYYPRLFLLNRSAEMVRDFEKELEFYQPSVDRTSIIHAEKGATIWNLLDVRGDELKTTPLRMAEILPSVDEETGQFRGRIDELRWSANSDHLLVKISYDGQKDWILVNVKDPKQSLNLTETFGMDFTQVEMADDSAGKLFVLENKHLRRIDTAGQQISRVLLDNVENFANESSNIVYVGAPEKNTKGAEERQIGTYRDGEKGGVKLVTVGGATQVRAQIANYYGDEYIGYLVDNRLTVLVGNLPTYSETGADLSVLTELWKNYELGSTPKTFGVSPGGGHFWLRSGEQMMVAGFEVEEVYQYDVTGVPKWLDGDMFYAVSEDSLRVWDYDNTNLRTLVATKKYKDLSGLENETLDVTTFSEYKLAKYPVILATNDKWLYYLVDDGDGGVNLVREKVRD